MTLLWIGIVLLLVLGVVGAFLLLSRRTAGSSGATSADVRRKIEQGATTIDVRSPSEYRSGHYTSAENIPLQELPDRLAEIGDKNRPIVIYCASGMRSAKAAKILTAAGFTDVTNAGGLSNLRR
jgi:phage shock protein E